jgi:hypothetical protein
MNSKQRHQDKKVKTYRETAEDHDTRIKSLEITIHEERLAKWAVRGLVGLIMGLLGGFWDLLAPVLVETRYFSFSYNEGVGLFQGVLICGGAILLFVSARMYEKEVKD